MIRFFDIIFSLFGLLVLLPFLIVFSVWIVFDSRGNIFYLQSRVGQFRKEFKLIKFRTMRTDSDKKGLLTVGKKDSRVTSAGAFLRKYKIDELPQLFNVLIGDMSIVGPRPEVKKYVDLYNEEQLLVLNVKPGITDSASIEYSNENEILGKSSDPESTYINEIMPHKLKLNQHYINNRNIKNYFYLIFRTLAKII